MKLEKTQHIMHYMNGREAKENDNVICKPWSPGGPATAGKIHSLNPGCTSCNGQVAYAVTGGMTSVSVTVGDCIHADDALAAVLVSLAPKADAQNTTAP